MSHFLPSVRSPLWFAALLGSLGIACNSQKAAPTSAEQNTTTSTSLGTGSVQTFGAPLGDSPAVALSQLLQQPSEYAGKKVRVEGHVRRACSAKGCWMELSTSPEPSAAACRVTFKDYGFFVPTDSAGSRATVDGEVTLKRVRPEHVRHYEGEGAVFPSKHEDGSADEVRLVATGVELRR